MPQSLPAGPSARPDFGAGHDSVCPDCAHTTQLPVKFCPNCFALLDAACEDCGRTLRVRRVRIRMASAVRSTLEIAGALVIVFTFASIIGPIVGFVLILLAEQFGYRTESHHYCPACKTRHHPPRHAPAT